MAKSRPLISFDLDGVIAQWDELSIDQRTPEGYHRLELREPDIPERLERISKWAEMVITSARQVETTDVIKWLNKVYIDPWFFKSINLGYRKIQNLKQLKPTIHIDDSPMIYQMATNQKIPIWLMDNPGWPENKKLFAQHRIYNWAQLETMLNIVIKERIE